MGSTGDVTVKPDLDTNQQVAMISLKLLARHLAPQNPSQFKEVNCSLCFVLVRMATAAALFVDE
jgi:hypothetical protein